MMIGCTFSIESNHNSPNLVRKKKSSIFIFFGGGGADWGFFFPHVLCNSASYGNNMDREAFHLDFSDACIQRSVFRRPELLEWDGS